MTYRYLYCFSNDSIPVELEQLAWDEITPELEFIKKGKTHGPYDRKDTYYRIKYIEEIYEGDDKAEVTAILYTDDNEEICIKPINNLAWSVWKNDNYKNYVPIYRYIPPIATAYRITKPMNNNN